MSNSTITYPDGSSLTSTSLTDDEIQTAFQIATAQMLGILTSPLTVLLEFTVDSSTAIVTDGNQVFLYSGQLIVSPGVPENTTIISVNGTSVTMSNEAISSGIISSTVTDPLAFSKVRIGWQKQGQPGPDIDLDTVTLRCEPFDTDFSRMRDRQDSTNGNFITSTDVFTRSWKTFWTFYGPNSLDHARAVRSALITIQYVADLLATNNLYVNPSIEEPLRVPEDFQGEWWERVDLVAEFNEQVTETFTVGTVGSVEVIGFTKDGQFTDFTVTP